jgi:hypothetical protein
LTSSTSLTVHIGDIRGHWRVHLKKGAKVNEGAILEIAPLIAWFESVGITCMRPPWPTSEKTDLTLTRRARRAVRLVERIESTGSQISLLSYEVHHK